MVHAYDVENHLDALRAGADIMAHSAVTAPVDEEYLQLSRKNNVMYLATLSAYHDAFNPSALREFIAQDFVQKSIPKKTLSTLASGGPLDGFLTSVKASFIAGQWPVILSNLKKIFDRGIPIAIGPDTGIMGAFPGISVHRELELMAEASIPAPALVAAATSVPAKYFDLRGLGVIEEGAIADAVLTTKNPSVDIRNTRTVETVIKGGVVVDRAELLRKILSN
jgi:imidazolonepropionase-like amidohydrolase